MSRLIDADKLLGLFIESGQKHGSEHGCKLGENWLLDYNDIKAVIDNAPTIEPCTDCCESMKQAISEFNANYRKKGKWIPVKYRPLTTEERIEFAEHYGIEYCDTVDEKTFDCPMPEDGQEILISGSWGISIDVADNDIDGEGFIVYGLEGNGDWEGIDAWMPLLEPYKERDV